MRTLRLLLAILFIVVGLLQTAAAQRSYVYIQGDKQTPFYVKLEGAMQPRYGKNYCIIPNLEAGPIHLDILFQQNIFPAQHYTVLVPEGGSRGFLLTKQRDSFVLYDVQQQFYLENNNTEADDKVPTNNIAITAPVEAPQASVPVAAVPEQEAEKKPRTKERTKEKEPKARKHISIIKKETTSLDTATGEHFIEGISLGDEGKTVSPVTSTSLNNAAGTPSTVPTITSTPIPNSDCPTPLSREDFSVLYKKALNQPDDETRVGFLMDQMDKCYATWQARALATMLTTDAARFTVLQKIYPRITDQQSFPLLDDLLRDQAYKASFNQLLHPKL